MEKLSTLEMWLMASTLLLFILYIREKLKPKTEAEILYEKEQEQKGQEIALAKVQEIKEKDDEFKNLTKPVLFNGYHYHENEFSDKASLTLNVTDGKNNSKAFALYGEVDLLRKNAPFFMSIWQARIANDNFKKLKPGDVLF